MSIFDGKGKKLSRDEILKVKDIQTEEVEIPEWGGVVIVKGLTAKERDQYEAGIVKMQGKRQSYDMRDLRAKLVVLSVVDEEGKRIFFDKDIPALSAKSASAMQRVFEVAQRLSGITDEDAEDLLKN